MILMTSRSIPNQAQALHLGAAMVLLCPACSPRQPSNEVDIADAAQAARDAIGNHRDTGSSRPQAPVQAPRTRPRSPAGGATGTDSLPTASPANQGAALPADEDRKSAATTLRGYFRLIGARRYKEAWDLWDRDGAASGMSREAFAQSFAKYRSFDVEIGSPGRVDAGAGQRYVTFPVTVAGTVRDGSPFTMAGPVTLHRTGPIDGATERQRSWRIYESGLRPRPAPSDTADQISVRYGCENGTEFAARFDNRANTAVISLPSISVQLEGQPVGSGIHYAGHGYDLRGKGDRATFSRPRFAPTECRALS